ncbi:MAG: C2H2-type zinc finger protein [Candidatus Heimdallarchaeota archaeon]
MTPQSVVKEGKWHPCPHCDYKAKQKGNLTIHLAHTHDIGVTWHPCPHCDYKTKHKISLTKHFAAKHEHPCPQCDYEAKNDSALLTHLANKHGTGLFFDHLANMDPDRSTIKDDINSLG